LRDRLPDDYEDCSHLVTEDRVYSCGASIEEAFARSDLGERARPVVDRVREFEGYGTVREGAYRWVADNRDLWGKLLSKTPPARESGDEN
jgi:predicted DCC family thiol-disulfide oxidoreductase YuxK